MNRKTTAATTVSTGRLGERYAAEFLEREGYTLVEANWRWGRRGEIDLVMRRDHQIVFVEVKTRRVLTAGSPLEGVDGRKLQQMRRLATAWMAVHKQYGPYRLDVMGVYLRDGAEPLFEWLMDVGQ